MMQRRSMLQTLMAVAAWRPVSRAAAAQTAFGDDQRARLLTLAAAVLPSEIGADGQRAAVDQFLRWVHDYKAGAQRDHGYGVTALRTMPASPAAAYVTQLDDLDRQAGGSLATLALAQRQRVVVAAIATAGVRDLPGRPSGGHIATDLMSLYFNSPAANDLAFRRSIGRDACRGLEGSDQRPAALPAATGRG